MSIKAKLEALVYAAEEPITLDQMAALLKDDLLALKDLPAVEAHPEQADEYLGAVETENTAEVAAIDVTSTEDTASSSADSSVSRFFFARCRGARRLPGPPPGRPKKNRKRWSCATCLNLSLKS